MMSPESFLAGLRSRVESHPGVNHPLLCRLAHVPFTKEDYRVMGLQHFPLVGHFTKYLELLLLRAPNSYSKLWLAKVLVDEYGEGSDGQDHATLYQSFLRSCGVRPEEEFSIALDPHVTGFIEEHVRICSEEPFLVGLGAVGPGHEWAIPKMFPLIVAGLRQAGFDEDSILYFSLHMEQDIDHGTWLEEALVKFADTSEHQSQIERGAMLSLEARQRFWSGVQKKIVTWRQPYNFHLRGQGLFKRKTKNAEIDLTTFKEKLQQVGVAL